MNKKRTTKRLAGLLALALVGCLVAFTGHRAVEMLRCRFPELPDFRSYETLEERAPTALAIAKRRNLNEDYCLFIDYGIPSGTPRLFVWSHKENKVIARAYVMHGSGGGSTAEKPVFSNRPGSNCSALGHFIVTKRHGNKLKRSYRISGLDITNKSAMARGLMIHSSRWVDANCWRKHIPLHEVSCRGCVTVSTQGMAYLEDLIKREEKRLLLWSFCSDQDTDN